MFKKKKIDCFIKMGHNYWILMKWGPRFWKFHGEFDVDRPGDRKTAKTSMFSKNPGGKKNNRKN